MKSKNTVTRISANVEHDALIKVLEKHKINFNCWPFRETCRDDEDEDTYSNISWSSDDERISGVLFINIAMEAVTLSRWPKQFFIEARGEFGSFILCHNSDYEHFSSDLTIKEGAADWELRAKMERIREIARE